MTASAFNSLHDQNQLKISSPNELHFFEVFKLSLRCIRSRSSYRWTKSQYCVFTDTNDDRIIFLNFKSYLDSVLNVSAIFSKFAANVEDCQALCLSTPGCLSVNVATLYDDEQRHFCQMLVTTKNSEPDRFGPSGTFHHYNTIVSDPSLVIPRCLCCTEIALIYFKQALDHP